MDNYIGISENKMKHCLGVARKCYQIAKNRNYDEIFCRKMFMLGYVHDIGYEFSDEIEGHGCIAAGIIESLGVSDYAFVSAIKFHGYKLDDSLPVKRTKELEILIEADLSVDHMGSEVNPSDRLLSIGFRYGTESKQYKNAKYNALALGLVEDSKQIENKIYGKTEE